MHPDNLAALFNHYRPTNSEAARKLNKDLGYADPGNFNATEAMRSDPMQNLMKEVCKYILEMPPKDAPFVKITGNFPDEEHDKVISLIVTRGWLLMEEADGFFIYSLFGWKDKIVKQQKADDAGENMPWTK